MYDPQKTIMLQRLDADRISQATTKAELKDDIMKLVSSRYDALTPAAVRMSELNRRFGCSAVRLKTTCRDLLMELIIEDRLMGFILRDSSLFVDKAKHETRMDMFDLDHMDQQLEERDRILRRAFPEQETRTIKAKPKRLR